MASAPFFGKENVKITKWDIIKNKCLQPLLKDIPKFPNVAMAGLSRDMDFIRARFKDGKGSLFYTQQLVYSLLNHSFNLMKSAPLMKHPFLCSHGTEDKLTDPGATRRFYALCGSQDKTLHIVDGARH